MKKTILKSVCIFGVFALGFSTMSVKEAPSGDGWFWKSKTIPCTVTNTVGFDYIGVATTSETYAGTKKICGDGWSVCWSTFCS